MHAQKCRTSVIMASFAVLMRVWFEAPKGDDESVRQRARIPNRQGSTRESKRVMRKFTASLAAIGALVPMGFAHAQTPGGQPTAWQMSLPEPATAIMQELRWFEQFTLWFIIPITLFVLISPGLVPWSATGQAPIQCPRAPATMPRSRSSGPLRQWSSC